MAIILYIRKEELEGIKENLDRRCFILRIKELELKKGKKS
jgi:hypothetical protein